MVYAERHGYSDFRMRSTALRKKTFAWVLFLIGLLLLSLSATPYSRTGTVAMMSARLALVALVSILTVRERWRSRDQPPEKQSIAKPDAGQRLLERLRSWYYDEKRR